MSYHTLNSAVTAGRPGRFAVALAGLALPALLAVGCDEGGKAIVLKDKAEFDAIALHANKPALVMFFKGGCASCAALEPTFDKLAGEYEGRAVVAKLMILTFVFGITEPELHDRYHVSFVPYVVLLADGQEKKHWIMEYNADLYRKALDEVVGPPVKPNAAARASAAAGG